MLTLCPKFPPFLGEEFARRVFFRLAILAAYRSASTLIAATLLSTKFLLLEVELAMYLLSLFECNLVHDGGSHRFSVEGGARNHRSPTRVTTGYQNGHFFLLMKTGSQVPFPLPLLL